MECHLDLEKDSSDGKKSLHQARQNTTLGHMLKFDDFHPELIKSVDGFRQKQPVERKVHQSEELVKYMSKVPSFLERGENLPEKAFNVGVLDWRLLQKWQLHQKEIIRGNGKHTPFSSNTSPISSKNDGPENRFSAISYPPYSSKGGDRRSMDINRHSLAGESSVSVFRTDVSHEANKIASWLDESCSKNASIKLSLEIKQTVPIPGNISFSPSRDKKLEEKNLSLTSKNLSKNESFDQELNPKTGIPAVGKVRNPSPTRRFSFDRSSSSKETLAILHSGAKDFTVKSGPDVTYSSKCDKSSDISRARSRSSPLRRFLDPLLKPKAGKSDNFGKEPERNSSTTDRTVKSSTERGECESPASHFVSVKSDLKGCKTIDTDNPNNDNTGSRTVQALLQVAVKNGLPLFTFAVDNNRDILAATVKNISSRKNEWMYTFFSIQEMKKKNGHWINQGGKDRNRGYIPNVVAEMRVSDVFSSDSCRERSVVKTRTREFVLFSVGTRDVDVQASDLLPSDELAAIIVKFPGKIDGQINRDVQIRGNSIDDEGNLYLVPSVDVLSTTVVLPGGDHGLPGKGEPSPLIERWKSGGSCDCGGWDMGCKIRVLANHNQSSECSSTERRFKLFSQDETSDAKAVFSLSWFKDGILSVEFSSSLKLVQAFSIGIAVFNGMKPAIFAEPDNFVGHKTCDVITLPENNVAKISKQEVSAKYASFPPLSPVGRV